MMSSAVVSLEGLPTTTLLFPLPFPTDSPPLGVVTASNDSHQNSPSVDELCRTYMERAQTIATAMVSANASLRSRLSDADIPSYAGWALLKAALRWDPEKSPFESWLRVMIRFELEEAARFQAPVRRHGMQYLQLLAEAERYLGADASVEALAQHLEWPTERVRQVLSWRESSHEPLSLDNSLELSASSEVEDEALDRVVVSDAIRQLSDSERAVIFLHYFEDVPFNVIATELGLSKSKVSRIYSRAKRQLRTHLQAA